MSQDRDSSSFLKTRLWGFGRDRVTLERCLVDMNERALLISGVSRDYRIVAGDAWSWEIREFPPFFDD